MLSVETTIPETAPPRKAVLKALARDSRAALAVLMLVLTDTFIPMKPERIENPAPMRKAMATGYPR